MNNPASTIHVHVLRPLLVGLGLTLSLGACAGTQLRNEASALAGLTTQVARDAERVVAARDQIARSRTDNLHDLEESATRLETMAERKVSAWSLAKQELLVELHAGVKAAVDEEAQRLAAQHEAEARRAKALAAAKSGTTLRADQLRVTATKLGQLGKDMNVREYADFYIDLATEVKGLIDAANADAEEAAK